MPRGQPTPESRSYEPPAAEELPDDDRTLETAPGFAIVTGGDTD